MLSFQLFFVLTPIKGRSWASCENADGWVRGEVRKGAAVLKEFISRGLIEKVTHDQRPKGVNYGYFQNVSQ